MRLFLCALGVLSIMCAAGVGAAAPHRLAGLLRRPVRAGARRSRSDRGAVARRAARRFVFSRARRGAFAKRAARWRKCWRCAPIWSCAIGAGRGTRKQCMRASACRCCKSATRRTSPQRAPICSTRRARIGHAARGEALARDLDIAPGAACRACAARRAAGDVSLRRRRGCRARHDDGCGDRRRRRAQYSDRARAGPCCRLSAWCETPPALIALGFFDHRPHAHECLVAGAPSRAAPRAGARAHRVVCRSRRSRAKPGTRSTPRSRSPPRCGAP